MKEASGEAEIGIVIRDLLVSVKLTAWQTMFDASNAEEMEALACKEGIGLAAEWFQEPVMEPDCTVAVQYLKEVKVLKPVCLSIIQEASHAASRLPGFELNHVKR